MRHSPRRESFPTGAPDLSASLQGEIGAQSPNRPARLTILLRTVPRLTRLFEIFQRSLTRCLVSKALTPQR